MRFVLYNQQFARMQSQPMLNFVQHHFSVLWDGWARAARQRLISGE